MPNIVAYYYWAKNKLKERLMKWEEHLETDHLAWENRIKGDDDKKHWATNKWEELLMKWEEYLEKDHLKEAWENRIRGDDDKKRLIGVSNPTKSCNAGLPIDRSPIQFREQTMKRRGPDGAANLKLILPEPFQILLRDGMNYLCMNYLLPVEKGTSQVTKGFTNPVKGARVHDWVSVCLSSKMPIFEMVTPKEFKFFIKDLVCKGEAIGMDFYPRAKYSMWPRLFAPTSMFELENVLVLAELAALLRCLGINGMMVQLVLIVLPYVWEGDNKSLHAILMNIRILCEKHGVIYHECFSHEVRKRRKEYIDSTAREIMEKAIYHDSIKKTEGDLKAAEYKEIGGDGGSKERLDIHPSGSPNVSDDETQDKEQGGDGGSEHESSPSGSPNVSDDETQEDDSSDKEQGGDGGSEHESSTHSDGFPGSVGGAESEDELPTDSGGGFHGPVDEMVECIDHSILQVNEKGNVKSWAYISFSMSLKETRKFLTKLIGTCIGMGMGFNSCAVHGVHVKPGSFTDVEDALWHMHDTISQIFSVYGGELGLLFVILPDKEVGDETYDKSEKVCDKLGFVYQCCSPEDARNPSMSYLQTTAYEINDKVVRRDDVLPRNFVMPFSAEEDDPTIVFGADIFCDSNISVASVVATFDWPVSSRYSAFVTEQPYKEVTIKNLHNENESMVRRCLFAFFEKTKKWPCRIIFFRNGVDEGQLSFIFSQEIDAIRKACTSIFPSTLLITYVVVGRAESAVGEGSCCPATFEFSCSHPVVGGTGTNDVAYRVLHDENQYDAVELQSLCINLCTNRVRWAHPEVSMAPTAYYAHLAASRAHAHISASRAHAHIQESHDGESTTSAQQLPPKSARQKCDISASGDI